MPVVQNDLCTFGADQADAQVAHVFFVDLQQGNIDVVQRAGFGDGDPGLYGRGTGAGDVEGHIGAFIRLAAGGGGMKGSGFEKRCCATSVDGLDAPEVEAVVFE